MAVFEIEQYEIYAQTYRVEAETEATRSKNSSMAKANPWTTVWP